MPTQKKNRNHFDISKICQVNRMCPARRQRGIYPTTRRDGLLIYYNLKTILLLGKNAPAVTNLPASWRDCLSQQFYPTTPRVPSTAPTLSHKVRQSKKWVFYFNNVAILLHYCCTTCCYILLSFNSQPTVPRKTNKPFAFLLKI